MSKLISQLPDVSILIVMDVLLEVIISSLSKVPTGVSILIVMDVLLEATCSPFPCYPVVSILIVMDVLLEV